jgi:hypothetical protein
MVPAPWDWFSQPQWFGAFLLLNAQPTDKSIGIGLDPLSVVLSQEILSARPSFGRPGASVCVYTEISAGNNAALIMLYRRANIVFM